MLTANVPKRRPKTKKSLFYFKCLFGDFVPIILLSFCRLQSRRSSSIVYSWSIHMDESEMQKKKKTINFWWLTLASYAWQICCIFELYNLNLIEKNGSEIEKIIWTEIERGRERIDIQIWKVKRGKWLWQITAIPTTLLSSRHETDFFHAK